MILVTVGSQKFQFNRLLKEIDILKENNTIKDDVFAQIGYSDYKPNHYEYVDFLKNDEFAKKMEKASLIITHAGTGTIINALKKEKKVIAIPRLSEFNEHVDNHQIQIINQFEELNLIEAVYDISKLKIALENVSTKQYNRYVSNKDKIIESIEKFIEE